MCVCVCDFNRIKSMGGRRTPSAQLKHTNTRYITRRQQYVIFAYDLNIKFKKSMYVCMYVCFFNIIILRLGLLLLLLQLKRNSYQALLFVSLPWPTEAIDGCWNLPLNNHEKMLRTDHLECFVAFGPWIWAWKTGYGQWVPVPQQLLPLFDFWTKSGGGLWCNPCNICMDNLLPQVLYHLHILHSKNGIHKENKRHQKRIKLTKQSKTKVKP